MGFATSKDTPSGTKADPLAITIATRTYPIHPSGFAPILFSYISRMVVYSKNDLSAFLFVKITDL